MIDEHYDRHYRAARNDLNEAIVSAFDRLGRAFANAFVVLNRIEYSSPWGTETRKARSR